MGGGVREAERLHHHLCFLDVGHGNSTVLIDRSEAVVIIDAGRRSALCEFLTEQQITRIKSVYLSHADADHIGGLVGLLSSGQFSIDRVFLNPDAQKGTAIWDDLVYELDAARRNGNLEFTPLLTEGQTECVSERVFLEVLGPSTYLVGKGSGSVDRYDTKIQSNSISAVIAITIDDIRLALLPADLDSIGLRDLLDKDINLNASILVFPHHGGSTGTRDPEDFAEKLLSAVDPDRVIFSIARGQYDTPDPIIVNTIRATLPNARIICTQLSEHCSQLPPTTVTDSHIASVFAQGRNGRSCCGGTIVVPLDQAATLRPDSITHMNFIRDHVKTPLCVAYSDEVPVLPESTS